MTIYISYFYQIRFFTKKQIPISTALYDPSWYHDYKSNQHIFKDKNDVYNGLRANILTMPQTKYRQLESSNEECHKNCSIKIEDCKFMKMYRQYLDTLDFNNIVDTLYKVAKTIQEAEHLDECPDIVLIVHEASSCKCAERPVLQAWFKEHGLELKEWRK